MAAVDLRSVRIAGDLDLRQARVANPGQVALRLNTATVDGRAILSELVVERGGLDFRDSAVGAFWDDPASALPAEDGFVQLTGLTYRGVPGHPGVTVRERLAWLDRMPAYAAQPYRQLAAAYQGAGHEDEARRVLVAQQQHLHRSLTGWTRLRHRLFGLTLQYGYQPVRAVALLARGAGDRGRAVPRPVRGHQHSGRHRVPGGGPDRAGRRQRDPAGVDRRRRPLPARHRDGGRAGAGRGRLAAHAARVGDGDAGGRRLYRLGAPPLTGQETGSVSMALPFQVTSNFEIWSRDTGTTMSSRYESAG